MLFLQLKEGRVFDSEGRHLNPVGLTGRPQCVGYFLIYHRTVGQAFVNTLRAGSRRFSPEKVRFDIRFDIRSTFLGCSWPVKSPLYWACRSWFQ